MAAKVYEGPSLLDGSPIIVSVTGHQTPSTNSKTGPMAQAYIMLRDIPPHEAVKTGADASICGDCIHRCGSCYVLTHQGPLATWNATSKDLQCASRIGFQAKYRGLRLGAYGDPAAAPTWVWRNLTRGVRRYTGFTHQWRHCDPELMQWCMASVESEDEAAEAQALGWRTARTKLHTDPIAANEVQCPHETHGVTCQQCGLCAGTSVAGKHIVGNIHGAPWKQQRFLKAVA